MLGRCGAALLSLLVVSAWGDDVLPARFHHVRINATNPAQSMRFYRRVFGAVPIKFNDAVDALFVERSFLIFNHVDEAPDPALNTGIWHIGWGGVDVPAEYEWWKRHDVEFQTPPTPLPGVDNYYMYLYGPDRELIEINTMGHHRFAHVHFFCDDVNETVAWYARHLGLKPGRGNTPKPAGDMSTLDKIWINTIQCDNVILIFFGKPDIDPPPVWWKPQPPLRDIQPTKGRPIDHIAFSVRSLEPLYEQMKQAGAEIVEPVRVDERLRLKSFFARAPDGVLVEIVEAKPIPEGAWD
jgi:catechol 2,3-dioxygenase-like lactoylglutathione lyase family enzyme